MVSETNYYMIVNTGTLILSQVCQRYPFHLVLAQQYIADEMYRHTLAKMQELDTCRIILDNGAHEGIDIDTDIYQAVIKELEPDCVVLPDLVGRPGVQSYDLSMSFVDWMKEHQPDTRLMFAAQGTDTGDVLKHYAKAIMDFDPKDYIIGFGQAYLKWVPLNKEWTNQHEAARHSMIGDIISYLGPTSMSAHQFHILGGRWNPASYEALGRLINIVGLDSVKPCTCTRSDTMYPVRIGDRAKIDLCDSTYKVPTAALTKNIDRFVDAYGLKRIDWAPMYGTKAVW